jgi:hypothetical protein
MLCYAMLCYAVLCYAVLCYAMLCYAILYYANYAAKKFKQCKDDVSLYTSIIRCKAWERDVSCHFVGSHLRLSAALGE